jgi:hypothetical protein
VAGKLQDGRALSEKGLAMKVNDQNIRGLREGITWDIPMAVIAILSLAGSLGLFVMDGGWLGLSRGGRRARSRTKAKSSTTTS